MTYNVFGETLNLAQSSVRCAFNRHFMHTFCIIAMAAYSRPADRQQQMADHSVLFWYTAQHV